MAKETATQRKRRLAKEKQKRLEKKKTKDQVGMKLPEAHSAEIVSPVPIKAEVELLAEHPFAPDLADQELKVNMATLQTIKTEELSGTDVQTQQTANDGYKCAKTELMSDQEFVDEENDSNGGTSSPANNLRCASLADDQETRVTTANNGRQSCVLNPYTQEKKKNRVFKCEICPSWFYHKTGLAQHMWRHDKNRMESCHLCKNTFYSKSSLALHMKNIHPRQTETQESISEPQTTNNQSVQIKTEMSSDEEFCDELDIPPAQGSQRNAPQLAVEQQDSDSLLYKESEVGVLSHAIHAKDSQPHCKLMFKCGMCPRSCSNAELLRLHIQVIHDKDRMRKFTCQSCLRAFDSKANLMSHISQTHTGDTHKDASSVQSSKDCEVAAADDQRTRVNIEARDDKSIELCHKSYPKKLINSHMRLGHTTSTYKCEFCPRSFTSARYLRLHAVTHAKHGEGEFTCQLCLMDFYTKGSLTAHVKSHTVDTSPDSVQGRRLFTCESCGRAFTAKGTLKTHMRTHTGDLYNCEVCAKRYTQKHSLKRHMLIEHSAEKQQDYLGPPTPSDASVSTKTELLSDEEFLDEGADSAQDSQEGAADNQRTRVNIEATDIENCELCHQSYPKKLMNSHMRLEHSERPYKCEFCPQSFTEARNLSKHIVTHDKERRRDFPCQSCERAFCSKGNLVLHMRSSHSEHKHQSSFAPLTSGDVSVQPDDLQHTAGPQASHKHMVRQDPHSKPEFKHRKLELTCQLCFKSFCSKESWVKHIVIAHPPDNDLPVENEERATVRVDGPQTPNYFSVHSEDKQQYTSTPLTSGVASVHSDEKQQNIPGLQASSDASVHPKTELMSDEEFLDEDSSTDSAEEAQKSDGADEAEFACQEYGKTY